MRIRKRGWTLLPLLVLWMAWPTPARCEQPLTPEQIVSSIDPNLWYLGSDVQVAMLQVILIGQEEVKRTAEEAVKAAVTPLKAENAQLKVERDEYESSWKSSEADLQNAHRRTIYVGIGSGLAGIILTILTVILVK